MDELVIRPNRLPGLLLTVFFVGMFAMNYYAFFIKPASLEPASFVIAVVFQAVWMLAVVIGVCRFFTPALRLTSQGFSIGNRTVAWSDVDTFESPKMSSEFGARLTRRIRIHYVPGFKRSRFDVALGKFAFGSAPTYLAGLFYRTGGQPLDELLWQFWLAAT
jgi:hypothetical protein